ncbi:MAG: hypothetical protein K2X99_08145 [Gemmatimonadaceae bacterium]|nr:hypothetical protein [Gemmatimonadaceae bacterium]
MRPSLSLALSFTLLAPPTLPAQHTGGTTGRAPANAPAAQVKQFDFLIGQWELAVTPKVSGLAAKIHGAPKVLGVWKAWRMLDGFGIEDELRITDASGNPSSLTKALRLWSPTESQWLITSADAYRGRITTSSASLRGADLIATTRTVDAEGKPIITRSRFSAITPRSFTWTQDRSTDDGKNWDEAVLVIKATRVSATAPRS